MTSSRFQTKTAPTYSTEKESPTIVLHFEQLNMNGPVISFSVRLVATCSDVSSLKLDSIICSQYPSISSTTRDPLNHLKLSGCQKRLKSLLVFESILQWLARRQQLSTWTHRCKWNSVGALQISVSCVSTRFIRLVTICHTPDFQIIFQIFWHANGQWIMDSSFIIFIRITMTIFVTSKDSCQMQSVTCWQLLVRREHRTLATALWHNRRMIIYSRLNRAWIDLFFHHLVEHPHRAPSHSLTG